MYVCAYFYQRKIRLLKGTHIPKTMSHAPKTICKGNKKNPNNQTKKSKSYTITL